MQQTQIIKTNLVINDIIYQCPNHFIHHYFPILIKHHQWNKWYIPSNSLLFYTLYCDWFEWQFKHFDNLLFKGRMFPLHWMCRIVNMKLMNLLLLDWIPCHFFSCVSMAINLYVVFFLCNAYWEIPSCIGWVFINVGLRTIKFNIKTWNLI